jgi:hypothetical protein
VEAASWRSITRKGELLLSVPSALRGPTAGAVLFNLCMDAQIRPEPTPAERDALALALREHAEDDVSPYASGWRASGLEFDEDYDATARPRSRLGATRA